MFLKCGWKVNSNIIIIVRFPVQNVSQTFASYHPVSEKVDMHPIVYKMNVNDLKIGWVFIWTDEILSQIFTFDDLIFFYR